MAARAGQTSTGIDTLRYAVEARAQHLTLQQIADRLNAEGHKTLRGGSWHPTTVKNLLAGRGGSLMATEPDGTFHGPAGGAHRPGGQRPRGRYAGP